MVVLERSSSDRARAAPACLEKNGGAPNKKGAPDDSQAMPVNPKKAEQVRPDEIVFLVQGDTVKSTKVKTGISDDSHIEITEGLTEGQEIVSGGYAAVSRLQEDGKKIKKEGNPATAEKAPPAQEKP